LAGDLRVLMFCPRFHPAVGGAERQADLVAATLQALGARVEILTPGTDGRWPLTDVSPRGVSVHRYDLPDLRRLAPRLRLGPLNTLAIGLRTVRAVAARTRSADVLHVHNVSAPMAAFAVRAARRRGLGTLAKVANSRAWFDLSVLRRQPIWGAVLRRSLLREVDRWQAISDATALDLLAAGVPADRIARIPNGVAIPPRPREIPRQAGRFLYLGRLARTAPRDVEGLVLAFEQVVRRSPRAELALVGGGDRSEEVARRVAGSPVGARVQMPGPQASEAWLGWAECLVQPSFAEGMSNALLEGMAAGLACVAYDISANREALAEGSAGLLVPVGDRQRLGSVLADLASAPGMAARLGMEARQRAERCYDIRAIARRVLAVYQELAAVPEAAAGLRGRVHALTTERQRA
jgi:glycosyltransferase involved in cell wall biosynthesis